MSVLSVSQSVIAQMQNKVRKAKKNYGKVRKVGKGKERQGIETKDNRL